MSSYLIALPSPIEPVRTRPEMMPVTSYDNGTVWHVYLSSADTTADYAGSRLLGGWGEDGLAITAIDPDVAEYLQPAGNVEGEAPASLALNHFMGHAPERAVQDTPDTLPQFPADKQPYQVTVERTVITDDGFAHIPHGFRFEIAFAAPSTEPTARSFGVYADEACTQYLWTPGAFQQVTEGEGEDERTVWRIDCPVGQRTSEPQDWHFAMLLGSLQVGKFTLPAGQQSTTRYFFEANRGEWGGGVAEWAAGTSYAIGDQVTYLGATYECRQAHTAIVGWYPNVVPALWSEV